VRVIIYGAGGVGGVVGGHLARAGHDVVLIGRPGHVQAIDREGLRLVTPAGTHALRLPAVTRPDQINFGPDDVVLLCMKGQNTEEALRDLRAVTSDAPIFCFQNGVRNEEIAAQYFSRVYGAMVKIGAIYLADGEVIARWDPPGSLVVGCYPRGTDGLVEAVAAKLRTAGFLVMVSRDVMPYKWGKLMDNLGNAITAISNARGVDADVIGRAARQELQDLLTETGTRWVSAEQLAHDFPETARPRRGSLDTEAQSSTWQSLARRTGTIETEFLNGEVVRLAEKLGHQAPVNEKLWHISLEMSANRETPGKYTPARLRKLVGLD